MNCKDTNITFLKKTKPLKVKLFKLEKENNNFYMLFELPYLKKFFLKLSISQKEYLKGLKKIKKEILKQFSVELVFIFIFSLVLTLFLFRPLQEAYRINENFIKDLLHDLNTPLTSLKLNLYLLKKEIPNHQRIEKLEHNIKTILNYQENLKNFLSKSPIQTETINIKDLIDEKLEFYSSNYPTIKFNNTANCKITINKNAFNSIIDNIISNAFKYNKSNGCIDIYMENAKLIIKDCGKGIKNPNKVFDRFYKENERGIGIGMNIVKKLCNELEIPIEIKSVQNKGTEVILNLIKYC